MPFAFGIPNIKNSPFDFHSLPVFQAYRFPHLLLKSLRWLIQFHPQNNPIKLALFKSPHTSLHLSVPYWLNASFSNTMCICIPLSLQHVISSVWDFFPHPSPPLPSAWLILNSSFRILGQMLTRVGWFFWATPTKKILISCFYRLYSQNILCLLLR